MKVEPKPKGSTGETKLVRIGDGVYRGAYRSLSFIVRKFLDHHRPRTATRWSGPQGRWLAECCDRAVKMWPSSSRKIVVKRLCDEIDRLADSCEQGGVDEHSV
jgi:hypothetical protein